MAVELLAPAGSKESFIAALRGGANAVYAPRIINFSDPAKHRKAVFCSNAVEVYRIPAGWVTRR